jgi:hypothetical protein
MTKVGRPPGPDLLQRAGKTWLHRVLRRHPGFWLPPVKELHQLGRSCRDFSRCGDETLLG